MKKNVTAFDRLNASIDGDLSPSDEQNLQNSLTKDSELERTYNDLKNVTKLISNIKPLSEDPFFVTRLSEKLQDNFTDNKWYSLSNFRKPLVSFSTFALVLMVVLKFATGDIENIFKTQKSNLIGFYTKNLQPVLFFENLNKEALFNFAFNQEISLDENKVLTLGTGQSGDSFFEVKQASLPAKSNMNLENFVTSLKLNNNQRKQVDSILESYSDKIASSVLVNDNHSMVVNPNLINLNLALRADLVSYAKQANETAFNKIIPVEIATNYAKQNIKAISNKARNNNNNQYFVLSKDSIFAFTSGFDQDSLIREVSKIRKSALANNIHPKKNLDLHISVNIPDIANSIDTIISKEIRVFANKSTCRIVIPSEATVPVIMPDLDNVSKGIDEAVKHFKDFTYNFKEDSSGGKQRFHFEFKIDSSLTPNNFFNFGHKGNGSFNFSLPNIDSSLIAMGDSLGNIFTNPIIRDSLNKSFRWNFNQKDFSSSDTSGKGFEMFFNGKSKEFFNSPEFNEEMKRLQKEMENFRKDMEDLRKDFKTPDKIKKKVKTVEI